MPKVVDAVHLGDESIAAGVVANSHDFHLWAERLEY